MWAITHCRLVKKYQASPPAPKIQTLPKLLVKLMRPHVELGAHQTRIWCLGVILGLVICPVLKPRLVTAWISSMLLQSFYSEYGYFQNMIGSLSLRSYREDLSFGASPLCLENSHWAAQKSRKMWKEYEYDLCMSSRLSGMFSVSMCACSCAPTSCASGTWIFTHQPACARTTTWPQPTTGTADSTSRVMCIYIVSSVPSPPELSWQCWVWAPFTCDGTHTILESILLLRAQYWVKTCWDATHTCVLGCV